jgi:hypothetical protein
MEQDYMGIASSGMKMFVSPNVKHYGATITNLVPGQDYFIRVAATNERATGPFAYLGGFHHVISAASLDVPTHMSWATVTPMSFDTLRVDFGSPLNEKPEGVNGSPVTKYQVDVASAALNPEIISLTTYADSHVSGFMELSVGYSGNYDMLVAIGNEPATFKIVPGSRWVDTMGDDLQLVLLPGENIKIEGELVTVEAVSSDGFYLNEYHVKGTGGDTVFGYRMDNYIGAATISAGDSTLIEISGRNLEPLVRPGDEIEIINDIGQQYLIVTSVYGSSLDFSPSYTGNTVTTPMHSRKNVVLPANASSAQMKASLESLQDIGTVAISREGPNSSEGFSWYITFTSNTGMVSLKTNTETVSYISVSGVGQVCDGDYITSWFVNGRPRYELFGKSCLIVYDNDDSSWKLFSSTGLLLSSIVSSKVIAPTSGWSNGVVVAQSDNTPVTLLNGDGATAEISLLQSSEEPPFDSIVFSAQIEAGEHEIQEVELSSLEKNLGGSFELALGTASTKVTINFDDSVLDLTTKLQSLPGVGRVHVELITPSTSFGSIWSVTFLTNSGDIPLLRHFGTSNLQGTSVGLEIREVVKGSIGDHHVVVDDLEPGQSYAVRVRAANGHGYGPYTTLARTLSSPPGEPSISIGRVTKSTAEFKFTTPPSNGSEISSYRFEWTTSSSFDSLARAQLRVSCIDGSDILGSFILIYGSDVASRSEKTIPIDIIGSTTDEIELALDSLTLINEVDVSSTLESNSEFEWIITFLYDVGNTGLLSVDSTSLRCQSEGEAVDSSVTMMPSGEFPADYGCQLLSNDDLCGSIYLAESSPIQYLVLSSSSGAISNGSYQLMLDDESSLCIPFDATEEQLKTAIEDFSHVNLVDVTRTSAPSELGFPYSYKISFIGSYAYGEWPGLKVNPSQFGAGDCDDFVGGSSHEATILPVRDESMCSNGSARTVAIVADAQSTLGGSFTVEFGAEYSTPVTFDTTAAEMEAILQDLTGIPSIRVSKHNYQDFAVGMAWAITFPRQTNDDNIFRIVDTHVTGRNARVDVYPVLKLSVGTNSVGDFRITLDGEPTAPIPLNATNEELLRELHRHNGIGKVNMLGPEVTEDGANNVSAIIDHSVVVKAHLADLDTIQVVPEHNWRGTSARLFFQPPSGMLPQTFTLKGLDKTKKYIVRASARNAEGFGKPSNHVYVKPQSTTPSAPISVVLQN